MGSLCLSVRELRGSHPGPATILLGSNLAQVVYSHCLTSLLRSKKLGVQKGVFGLDRFNGPTECVRLSYMYKCGIGDRDSFRTHYNSTIK